MSNPYCAALGIDVPRLEDAARSPDANHYALLIAALLERGAPMTLTEAARRFEDAGIAPAAEALASLKRCRPGRPPVYRDGDLYALDPHSGETDLWAFRLGLRQPHVARLRVIRPDPPPLPRVDEPLTVAHLDEAWRAGVTWSWSAQRLAICVLDAHGRPMYKKGVVAFVRERCGGMRLKGESARYWRRGAPVQERDDGFWELDPDHRAVRSARAAVRDRIEVLRKRAAHRYDPAVGAAVQRQREREREAHGERLARMRRVILHAFPATHPEALVLLDVNQRTVRTLVADALAEVEEALRAYEIIAAVEVRGLLRRLGVDAGALRLHEVGPPQKTITLNRRGRTLEVTTELLVRGSCLISRPFGEEGRLRGYLERGETRKLRRRLESDAKSLLALYQYGRLHGGVRVRWGFLDEMIRVPWVHMDETKLHGLMRRGLELGAPLEVVAGRAPGWAEPWSRARHASVFRGERAWDLWLEDEHGEPIEEWDVQAARVLGHRSH